MWSCPYTTNYCGKNQVLIANEKLKVLKPIRNYSEWFKNGQSCRYKIVFPVKATTSDKIAVHVKNLNKTKLLVVDTARYKSKKYTEHELFEGEVFMLEYPNILFAVFLTTSRKAGDF